MYFFKIIIFCLTFSYIVIEIECDFLKGLLLGSNLRATDNSDETEIIVIRIPSAKKKRPSKTRQTSSTTTTSTTTTTTTTSTTTTTPVPTTMAMRRPIPPTGLVHYYHSHYPPYEGLPGYGLYMESSARNITAKPIALTPSPTTPTPPTTPKNPPKVAHKNVCGANQTFTHCLNECGNTCETLHNSPMCTLQCYGFGCTCAPNYVRDERSDRCVAQQDCPQKIKCPVGERFYECGGCRPTCDQPFPECSSGCKRMGECDCAKGLVRNVHGKCVPISLCALNRSIHIDNRGKNSSANIPLDNTSLMRQLLKNIQQKSNQNNIYRNIH